MQVDCKTGREIIEFQVADAVTVKEKGCRVGKFGNRYTEQVRQGAVRICTANRDTSIVVTNPSVLHGLLHNVRLVKIVQVSAMPLQINIAKRPPPFLVYGQDQHIQSVILLIKYP